MGSNVVGTQPVRSTFPLERILGKPIVATDGVPYILFLRAALKGSGQRVSFSIEVESVTYRVSLSLTQVGMTDGNESNFTIKGVSIRGYNVEGSCFYDPRTRRFKTATLTFTR